MTPWIYLIISSALEVGWVFSVRSMQFSELKKISFSSLWLDTSAAIAVILPFVGYVGFGLSNIYCFSMALKYIPATTAFAAGMAMALAGMKMGEIFVFRQTSSTTDYICLLLLIVAVIGLKK
jgi:quaternary ammonium compound-resistance protein SugE